MSETPEISDIAEAHTVPAMEAVPPDAGMPGTPDIAEAHTIAMAAVPPDDGFPGTPMDFGPLIDEKEDFELPPMPSRRRRLRWTAWVALGLLVILIGAGIFAFLHFSHSSPVQYTQVAVSTGNLTVTAAGSGQVAPSAVYDLNFPASAPITAIYVKVGDRVTAGQKLAALDSTTLQDAVNQAQVNVDSAQTSLNQAEVNLGNAETQQSTALSIAKLNEEKALAACTAPGGSPTTSVTPDTQATATAESNCQQLARDQYTQAQQQANASVTSSSNQVNSAQQQLNNARTALQTAKDNLKNEVLLAPKAGVIEAVNGLVGETSNGSANSSSGGSSSSSSSSGSGSGSSSAFIVLIDDSTLSIQASVSEADVAKVAVSQPATFTVSAYPSQTFRASVASIDTQGTSSSGVVTYPVDLVVDMQSLNGAHIYSGMTATASITTAERISTLLAPSTALSFSTTALQNGEITRSQLQGVTSSGSSSGTTGSRGIVLELKGGQLVPVLVTTGLTNGQQTEILSGLKEGDMVVVGQTGGTTTTTSSSSSGNGTRGGGGVGGGGFGGGGGVGGGGGGGFGGGGGGFGGGGN